jgi:hypothetical protein
VGLVNDPRFGQGLWVLDGHVPVPAPDALTWGMLSEDIAARRVGLWRWKDPATERSASVSTVFLGQSAQALIADRPIRLFETLVEMQDGADTEAQDMTWRWDTWEEAAAKHAEIVGIFRRCLMLPED